MGISELQEQVAVLYVDCFVTQQESMCYTVRAQNPDDVPSFGSLPVFGPCQGCMYQIIVSA